MPSRLIVLLVMVVLLAPVQAAQARSAGQAMLCDTAISAAETTGRLPPRMLDAIAKVESGRPDPATGRLQPWPWTINAEGTGAFFADKQSAVAAVQALLARGVRSIDVGCLQVNLLYHAHAFATIEEAFDPIANARYATRFLNTLYANTHDWEKAIADYHSQTPILGEPYRQRVMALWRDPKLAGWEVGLAVAYQDFAPDSANYRAFEPRSSVYGAFAHTWQEQYGVLRR